MYISINTTVFIVGIEELFLFAKANFYYVVSNKKLTTGSLGASIIDNMTATTAIKNTKYSVCFKMRCLFHNFTNFQKPYLIFAQRNDRVIFRKMISQKRIHFFVAIQIGNNLINVKDTHLMNNTQPVAEILCCRLQSGLSNEAPYYHTVNYFLHNMLTQRSLHQHLQYKCVA